MFSFEDNDGKRYTYATAELFVEGYLDHLRSLDKIEDLDAVYNKNSGVLGDMVADPDCPDHHVHKIAAEYMVMRDVLAGKIAKQGQEESESSDAVIAASESFVKKDKERHDDIVNLITGLNAICSGIASYEDPERALEAISKGGMIREYVHTIFNVLDGQRGV